MNQDEKRERIAANLDFLANLSRPPITTEERRNQARQKINDFAELSKIVKFDKNV